MKDIWGLYGRQKKSFMMSTGVPGLLLRCCCSPWLLVEGRAGKGEGIRYLSFSPVDIGASSRRRRPKKQAMGGGGGGGDRSPLPASKGRLPKASLRQFTPPMAVVNNPNPKLTMEPSIIAPPDVKLPNVNMAQYGDPLGENRSASPTVRVRAAVSVAVRAAASVPVRAAVSAPVKAAVSAAASSASAAA